MNTPFISVQIIKLGRQIKVTPPNTYRLVHLECSVQGVPGASVIVQYPP